LVAGSRDKVDVGGRLLDQVDVSRRLVDQLGDVATVPSSAAGMPRRSACDRGPSQY
jgi:hypothetical protein